MAFKLAHSHKIKKRIQVKQTNKHISEEKQQRQISENNSSPTSSILKCLTIQEVSIASLRRHSRALEQAVRKHSFTSLLNVLMKVTGMKEYLPKFLKLCQAYVGECYLSSCIQFDSHDDWDFELYPEQSLGSCYEIPCD